MAYPLNRLDEFYNLRKSFILTISVLQQNAILQYKCIPGKKYAELDLDLVEKLNGYKRGKYAKHPAA